MICAPEMNGATVLQPSVFPVNMAGTVVPGKVGPAPVRSILIIILITGPTILSVLTNAMTTKAVSIIAVSIMRRAVILLLMEKIVDMVLNVVIHMAEAHVPQVEESA